MKKITKLLLTAMAVLALTACGGKEGISGEGQGGGESNYAEALDVLNAVTGAYGEDEIFASYGGNQENAVMDAPGKFDISKTEELEFTLKLPKDQIDSIDDAASLLHMMNANMFTGAVYHLKDGTDMDGFADAVKSNILSQQWICGQPDTLIIINVDGEYVVAAFGEAEIMESFKTNALSALSGAKVIAEESIS